MTAPDFKPKLIALDLDGTLLDGKGFLTDRTIAALEGAMSQGIFVAVATGRMYPSALPFIERIGTDAPCIFYNGALIKNPATGAVLFEKGVGRELTAEIMSMYRSRGWYIQLYVDDKIYVTDDSDPRCEFYESISKMKAVALGDEFWQFSADSTKLLGIADSRENFKTMQAETKALFGERIYMATSWGGFVEMVHPDVNKARALERVSLALGVERRDVLAVGDGSNDVEMVEWAGVGAAMENGSEKVKAVADIIAPSNDEDGVALLVEKFLS